jgi:hypothetical protein
MMTEPRFPFSAWGTTLPKEVFDYLPDDMRPVDEEEHCSEQQKSERHVEDKSDGPSMQTGPKDSGSIVYKGLEIAREDFDLIINTAGLHVNAAILDYHNNQIAGLVETISDLSSRLEKLEQNSSIVNEKAGSDHTNYSEYGTFEDRYDSKNASKRRIEFETTCNKTLFDLFEKDRRLKGFTRSQMMDYVLSEFFGLQTAPE